MKKMRKRERNTTSTSPRPSRLAASSTQRISQLESELQRLAGGDAKFSGDPNCSDEMRESHLRDVLAFESVGSGPSLFQGLLAKGVELPRPESLNEKQSAEKVFEILNELVEVQVFIVGFEHMTPREAYSKLWHETLWEGCYVPKKTPGAVTIMDASHMMSPSELKEFIGELQRASQVN